jgi:TrpR family trp operon transcriptional repressor
MSKSDAGWRGFIDMCVKSPDEKALEAMLELFLTPEERNDIARRYLIVQALIKAAKTQRDIAKTLDVSIAKITRGSNELKRMEKKWHAYLTTYFNDLS